MEQAPSTSFSRVESRLSFVSIDKTSFRTARQNIRSAAYMEDSFPHRTCFRQTSGRNSFISNTQVLGKGPRCVLSCTIPTFGLERSMPWREHKRLLFVSFKPGHKRDIVHNLRVDLETILECYTNSPTPLLESHMVKAHQVRSMAASLAFHRQASMEQILRADTWHCHNTFTDFYLNDLSLYSANLILLGPVVAAESILHPTLEIIKGYIVYIPPSIHLDSAPCEATEPG